MNYKIKSIPNHLVMDQPTFEQQQETARKVIKKLLIADNSKGICECLPYPYPNSDIHPIMIFLPKYYYEIGFEEKFSNFKILRKDCVFWFPCSELGRQQRIESIKRVYNL